MKSNKGQHRLYRYSLMYSFIILLSFVLIYVVSNSNSTIEVRRIILVPILLLIFLITNGFLLFLLKKVFILNRKHEKLSLEMIKYDHLEHDLKMYRQHRHDVKNHLTVMYELVQNEKYNDLKEYTKNFIQTTSNKLRQINTGSDELDVLIYNKIDLAKELKIDIDYHCQASLSLRHHSVIDIISIVSNLLDNALDANKKINDPSERMISVNIHEDQLDYVFVITNAFIQTSNPNWFLKDGFTTKTDKANHGLGIGIVNKLVDKYDGKVSIDIFNKKFYQMKIELPKHTL